MVEGLESFRKWFAGYEEQYTIIGGTACDLIMTSEDMDFRATHDIDLVLIVEALTPEFGIRFWDYIRTAGYEHRNKSTDEPQFYRFSRPVSRDYPAMIELFSRKLDAIQLPTDAGLTPLPVGEAISSLSAILLDDSYYEFLKAGKTVLDGVTILSPEHIIPFKMKAWLDLSERKARGEHVDSKDIKKHKNDVLRLSELLTAATKVSTPSVIFSDLQVFLLKMHDEAIDPKQLGIASTKETVLERIRNAYIEASITE